MNFYSSINRISPKLFNCTKIIIVTGRIQSRICFAYLLQKSRAKILNAKGFTMRFLMHHEIKECVLRCETSRHTKNARCFDQDHFKPYKRNN